MTTFIQDTNNTTLCIPRVFINIGEKRIRSVFYALKLGHIGRIDIVSKTSEKGERFNRVFIHFDRWFDTENALSALKLLNAGKDIKVIYDDPWFWKVSAYKPTRRAPHVKQVHNTAVSISDKIDDTTYDSSAPTYDSSAPTYDSSVPVLDYQNAPVPRRIQLVPKKHRHCAIYPIENELEDGEILE
jgi:hypothetical protein